MGMFYRYVLTAENGEEILYLYYANTYEFAQDFTSRVPKETMQQKINHYIKNRGIPFVGDKVYLVVDGIIAGTFSKGAMDPEPKEAPSQPVSNPILDAQSKPILKSSETDFIVFLEQSDHHIVKLSMEQYLLGVLASEILPSFHMEALKAQAVLCRTYAIKQMLKERRVKAVNENQIYRDISFYKLVWLKSYDVYSQRLKQAIQTTKGQYLAYEKQLINPLFHSVSSGITDTAASIENHPTPYLTSVLSSYDVKSPLFVKTTTLPLEQVAKRLNVSKEELTKIQILETSPGKRIQKIQVGNQIFTGIQFIQLLGLNSNAVSIYVSKDKVSFTTHGLGHGIGLSQYGANGMAYDGKSYQEILTYYYPHTKLWKLVRNMKSRP